MPKIVIDISNEIYSRVIDGELTEIDNMFICGTVANGTPLKDYCLTQCETGNPCLYCKYEFENKIIDKHIDDKCTADDCDECKNNYDCISYLEEHERINNENEIGD